MRQAVKQYARWKRERVRVDEDVRRDVDGLSKILRQKLIDKGLLDARPEDVMPTLSEWLARCYKSGRLGDVDYRKAKYLIEYHGDVRIDLIKEEGEKGTEGFRHYLSVDRPVPFAETTINKAIEIARRVFKWAVPKLIKSNPYEDVPGGSTSNPDNYYRVKRDEWQRAVDSIPNDTPKRRELRLVMAFARWQGGRIPSEIRNLKFTDFEWKENGDGSFIVPKEGKTGMRGVPVFPEFVPYFKDIESNYNDLESAKAAGTD